MSDTFFHSNDNYEVVLNEEGNGYDVRNSNSGVVEFDTPQLPEALFAAENLNSVLVNRTYLWKSRHKGQVNEEDVLARLRGESEAIN